MVHVIVTMQVKPGQMDEFSIAARRLASLVQAETGCLQYEYTVETEFPLPIQESVTSWGEIVGSTSYRVILLERWESKSALGLHHQAPHMKKYGPRLKQFLVGPSTARITRSIQGG